MWHCVVVYVLCMTMLRAWVQPEGTYMKAMWILRFCSIDGVGLNKKDVGGG